MRETCNSYLKKLVASTKNTLTRPAAEQTREYKEAAANSPLQGKITTPLGQTDHYAHLAEAKSKKHCIPFVALALALLLASLCALALLQIRPIAFAHNKLALDATATSVVPEAAPQGQTITDLKNAGHAKLGPGSDWGQTYTPGSTCTHPYHTHVTNPATGKLDPFCWNEVDFTWADRDVTCLNNPSHNQGNLWQLGNSSGNSGTSYIMVDKKDTQLQIPMDEPYLNQNTCTDNSECRSDNASLNDDSSSSSDGIGSGDKSGIRDQTGGDDILCGNQSCLSDAPGQGNADECGDPNGPQRIYDRFACHATNDTTSTLEDQNQAPPNSAGRIPEDQAWFGLYLGEQAGDQWWWSTGIYYNPSAYDPNGALYLPTTNLYQGNIKPSADTPACDASEHWACPNADPITIYQYSGAISLSSLDNQYEEIVPHYSPDQFTEVNIQSRTASGPVNNTSQAWRPGSPPVPVYWVVCNPVGGGWQFPCSDQNPNNNGFVVTTTDNQSLSEGQVTEKVIIKDWLSGNVDQNADKSPAPSFSPATPSANPTATPPQAPSEPGHLAYTYLNDTVQQPGLAALQPYMLGLGFVLLSPILVLIGYQLLWASWTLGRAGAMEAFGRMILSIMAIVVSYQLAAMLIELANTFNLAVVALHAKLGYPTNGGIDNMGYDFSLQSQGENDPTSFRGIVVPITRWGCVANDFISLLANKFWTDVGGFAPFVGGITKFIGNIFNAVDAAKHIGEFAMLILSINLCTQVFMRVVLLNYYVLTSPLAFSCWGLPEGVGQKVVSSWVKGFLSLLFAQTAQIFVLTTFPLILPPFPTLPTDRSFGILIIIFQALPRILVLAATIKVPTMMGTGATKAIAQAGTVVGGAVVAAGGAAMHTV